MARFEIFVTEEAERDIHDLNDAIEFSYQAPLTASRYVEELNTKMQWLANGADFFPVVPELSYQYGCDIRRLNFKKMAILYSIEGEVVNIHRIIPQSMVIY
jgi:plasmid stabilization system protein ParE